MRGNTAGQSLRNRTCTLHVALPSQGSAAAAGVPEGASAGPHSQAALLVSCQHPVPPERAHAMCAALMKEVCPEQVSRYKH